MLTTKQKELLMFIHERLKETGVPPSFDEMKEALDLKSKSGIHRLITALEERGFVRRLPHRARAMEIVRLPDSMPQALAVRARGFSPSVIEGSLGRVPEAVRLDPELCLASADYFSPAIRLRISFATSGSISLGYRPRQAD